MKPFYPKSLITLLLLALLASGSLPAQATHILGGELTYTLDPANPLKIRAQLTLYTDFSLTNPDNVNATVFFGPNQSVTADRYRRTIVPGWYYTGWYYKSIYFFDYFFPATGTYTMSYCEQNRAVGIVNITDSQNQAYCIATQVVIDPLGTSNLESAQFLTSPINAVPTGQTVQHHIGAYDPEGDSLSFQLVPGLGAFNAPVNGYVLPLFIQLNAWTGALTYTNPEVAGQYAFAVKITEYRNKRAIGYVVRDFSVLVVQQTATFGQSLTVTPAAGITITPQNHIFISPNQLLSLQALLQDDPADSTRLEVYSDLFAKTDKLQVTQSASGESKMMDIRLEADPALKRNAPYLIVLRAASLKRRDLLPPNELYFQEKGFWIFIGSDIVNGLEKADPAKRLALYPNPAEELIYLELPGYRKGMQLQVYNDGGQLVWQQSLLSPRTLLYRKDFGRSGKFIYTVSDHRQVTHSGQFLFK